eukprot:COSAG02_NODE_1795_length_10906_cov_5.562084_5_plen_99_part_00
MHSIDGVLALTVRHNEALALADYNHVYSCSCRTVMPRHCLAETFSLCQHSFGSESLRGLASLPPAKGLYSDGRLSGQYTTVVTNLSTPPPPSCRCVVA